MENNNIDIIINEFVEALKLAEIEESKYSFFNSNEFQMKFKNLLAFACILGAIGENFSEIKLENDLLNKSYIIEKYCRYIKGDKNISEEEEEKALKFSYSIKKLYKPDGLITKFEDVFGKDSFFTISINSNYRTGLHALVKQNVFDAYMNNLFKKSRKYKIWKLLVN